MTFLNYPRQIFYTPTGIALKNGAIRLTSLTSEGLKTDNVIDSIKGLNNTPLNHDGNGFYPLDTEGGGVFDITASAYVQLYSDGWTVNSSTEQLVGNFYHTVSGSVVPSIFQDLITNEGQRIRLYAAGDADGTGDVAASKVLPEVYFTASQAFSPILDYDTAKAKMADLNAGGLSVLGYDGLTCANVIGTETFFFRLKTGSIDIDGTEYNAGERFTAYEPGVTADWDQAWDRIYGLLPGSVETEKLADDAVTNAKLAADAVTAGKIADGNVLSNHLANLSVTTPRLSTLR